MMRKKESKDESKLCECVYGCFHFCSNWNVYAVCVLYVQHKVKHEQLPIYVAATNVGWIEYECMYTNYTSWITLRKYFIMKGTHSRSIGRSKSLCVRETTFKKNYGNASIHTQKHFVWSFVSTLIWEMLGCHHTQTKIHTKIFGI